METHKKFNLTKKNFNELKKEKLNKLFNICLKERITLATLFMTSHICYRIYNEELFDDPELDWDIIFLIVFWISTKFIICEKYYTVYIVYDNADTKYDIDGIKSVEIAILQALEYNLGHNKIWKNAVPENEFPDYIWFDW